jgi:pantetheine-phosphate adenylyltransferase
MKRAIFPGSFDPVTEGHLDIIRRAAALFDRFYVAVMVNVDKKTLFTWEERVGMLRKATAELVNVEIVHSSGLLADFAASLGANTIVKGVRNSSDFDDEYQMALINSKLNPGLDTIFLPTRSQYMYLSSTAVRSVAGTGGDITGFVPNEIMGTVLEKTAEKRKQDRIGE